MSQTLHVDVRHSFGPVFTLEVRFDVAPGITALRGSSGAGKSTVLRLIAGLMRPERGSITLGSTVWSSSERFVAAQQRRAAMVFQSLALFPHLSVLENVLFGVAERGAAAEALAHKQLERLRVAALAHRRPSELSGGEAQRVALARALAAGPQVLLLDEPFASLDEPLRRALRVELTTVTRELNVPVLLVTHDDADAALAQHTLTLSAGRLV